MTNETFSDRLKLAMQAKQFKQVDLKNCPDNTLWPVARKYPSLH